MLDPAFLGDVSIIICFGKVKARVFITNDGKFLLELRLPGILSWQVPIESYGDLELNGRTLGSLVEAARWLGGRHGQSEDDLGRRYLRLG
jgi:hypothetical protein